MEGGLAVMRAIGHQHLPQAGHGSAVKQRQEGPVGQHQLGAAMGNDIAHLAGRQAPVHWHVYGAQLGGGQRQQQGLDMELGQHCHGWQAAMPASASATAMRLLSRSISAKVRCRSPQRSASAYATLNGGARLRA